MIEIYYFGCWGQPGHVYHVPRGSGGTPFPGPSMWQGRHVPPWGSHGEGIDGKLQPLTDGKQVEGWANLYHKEGWTALSFWDRTGDKRGNSNSTFLAYGTFTFESMVKFAKVYFPEVYARISQRVVIHLKEVIGE